VTRFIAINRLSYDTWRMRLILTLLFFVAVAFVPATASAFDIEETLREQHVQYQGRDDIRVVQSGGMSLSQAIESIKVLTKDGKVKTYKVNGRSR